MTGEALAPVFLQAALMILLPPLLWGAAARWSGLGRSTWRVVGWGCLFFLASQLVNTPLRLVAVGFGLSGGALVVMLSLIAGLGEELSRWVGMGRVAGLRERLGAPVAAAYGLGHGGFESLALGLAVLAQGLVLLGAGDPAAVGELPGPLAEQARLIAETPWYVFLAGVLERALAIVLHVGLSLIVASGLLGRSAVPLLLAVLLHTAVNASAVMLQQATGNVWLVEAWIALTAVATLAYGAARVSSGRTGRGGSTGASAATAAGSGAEGSAGRS